MSHITLIRGTKNCTIRSNVARHGGYYSETMHFPGSSAINVHSSRAGTIVEGNFAAYQVDLTGNDGNGYIADVMSNGAGVLYRNNIAFRNMGAGLNTTKSPHCIIVNNTFIENGHNSYDPGDGAGIQLSRQQDINQTIVNNLFYNNKAAGILSDRSIHSQNLIDYNLYYAPNGAPLIWDGSQLSERAYTTAEEIRQNSPWEKNGKIGDPKFRDLDNQDFRLQPHSPAIDAGQIRSEVVADFDGRPRPQGAKYDIGAFEFTASALENPAAIVSGIGVVSGWKCSAEGITVRFDGNEYVSVAYGSERMDTFATCGDANNGFVLLINYNTLGDGTHTVDLYDAGVLFASRTFTVVTPGTEFLSGVNAAGMIADFPQPGQHVVLEWNEAAQRFELVEIVTE